MNNLRKFATEADYSAATLNYPAVSWVVSGDTVHYDKTSGDTPTPPTPVLSNEFAMAFSATDTYSGDVVLWNVGATDNWSDLSSMTINDTAIESPSFTPSLSNYSFTNGQTYVVKYGVEDDHRDYTYVSECLTGSLGGGWGSGQVRIDFHVPSQVTEIANLPSNIANLVIAATTPPTTSFNQSSLSVPVYVPDSALSAYQNDATWYEWGDYLKPISEYNGALPI